MSASDDRGNHRVVRPEDVTDLALVPGELRAFRTEMRDSLEGIARALQSLGRIEERLEIVIDRQNVTDQRIASLEERVSALETRPKRARKK